MKACLWNGPQKDERKNEMVKINLISCCHDRFKVLWNVLCDEIQNFDVVRDYVNIAEMPK